MIRSMRCARVHKVGILRGRDKARFRRAPKVPGRPESLPSYLPTAVCDGQRGKAPPHLAPSPGRGSALGILSARRVRTLGRRRRPPPRLARQMRLPLSYSAGRLVNASRMRRQSRQRAHAHTLAAYSAAHMPIAACRAAGCRVMPHPGFEITALQARWSVPEEQTTGSMHPGTSDVGELEHASRYTGEGIDTISPVLTR